MKTMSKKKKIIILSVMVALLLVTGYVNVALNSSLTGSATTASASATTANFYASYRSEREATRTQEIQFYDSILSSETSSDSAKAEAELNKNNLIAQMEKELVTEGIIVGKGFSDAIVTSSNTNVNVFIKSKELTSTEVAQITSVVTEQLGVEIDKVIIIPSE